MTGILESTSYADTALAASKMRKLPSVDGAAARGMDVRQARKVAEDFESVFLSQMLQPMFAEIEPEAPFGGGPAEDVWRGMLVDEYGKIIAKGGGIGIADAVFRQILKQQEVQ